MGLKVPCNACGKRNDCCKDINQCEHFQHFYCGDLASTLSAQIVTGGDQGNLAESFQWFSNAV